MYSVKENVRVYIPIFYILIKLVVSDPEVEVSDAVHELAPDGAILAQHEAIS